MVTPTLWGALNRANSISWIFILSGQRLAFPAIRMYSHNRKACTNEAFLKLNYWFGSLVNENPRGSNSALNTVSASVSINYKYVWLV